MAYTLKASGIATNAVMVVAVDQDGTIKEFVSSDVNSNKTLGTGVAASVASATWKSVSQQYFAVTDASFDYNGVRFASGHRPSYTSAGSAISVFMAFNSLAGGGGGAPGYFIERNASGTHLAARNGATGQLRNSLIPVNGTTNLPSDSSTKVSAGFSYDDVSAGSKFYYGLESGSLAADGTDASVGFGPGAQNIFGIGGATGQGSQPGNYHFVAVFNRALTLAEFQSLHNDWFGTMFDAGSTDTLMGQACL